MYAKTGPRLILADSLTSHRYPEDTQSVACSAGTTTVGPGFPNCAPPAVTTCGADGCARDTIIGNCKGCWVQFSQYFLSIPGSSTDYKCNIHNNGYICRIDPAGTCDFGQLPTEMSHWIPSVVSASYRGGNSALSDMCCDGDGTYNVGGTDCPALTPNAAACDDPPIWGPGT